MTVYIPQRPQRPVISVRPTLRTTPRAKKSVQQRIDLRKLLIILGIPIDNMTMDESLDRIEQMVAVGRKTGNTHQIATVNTDFLIKSLDDEPLRNLLQSVDMCTADGMPLVWGSKLLGVPLKERVAGSDMVPLLAERAANKGLTLYLMGAGPGVAAKAGEILTANNPNLQIVGHSAPFWKPGEEMDPAVLADIKAANPDILLVALGNPKQELWIQQYREEVGVPVMIGIGASLDFIVGVTKRAPEWMQHSGLEWLSRLLQEPRRLWKRYTSNIARFGPNIMRQWWMMRANKQPSRTPFVIASRIIGDTTILNVEGKLDYRQCRTLLRSGQRALANRPNLTVNIAQIESIDCAAVGALMELRKATKESGGTMRLVGIQHSFAKILKQLNMTEFFDIQEENLIMGCPY